MNKACREGKHQWTYTSIGATCDKCGLKIQPQH